MNYLNLHRSMCFYVMTVLLPYVKMKQKSFAISHSHVDIGFPNIEEIRHYLIRCMLFMFTAYFTL